MCMIHIFSVEGMDKHTNPWNQRMFFQLSNSSWKWKSFFYYNFRNMEKKIRYHRIPISRTLQFNNPCFKKRLFVYIFPVIFFSLLLNIFKFMESSVVWSGGKVNLAINQIRLDYIYLLINGWVRWGNEILIINVTIILAFSKASLRSFIFLCYNELVLSD